MPQTTVVGARVPVEDAALFEQQAARYGLSKSAAVAALIKGALVGPFAIRREPDPAARARG